uniref:Centromere protein X n=1 Tax=Callithrix jacchus TaxID=9483 RepID=A0A8I3WVK2_CALJA
MISTRARLVEGHLQLEITAGATQNDHHPGGVGEGRELVSRLLHAHFKDDKTKVSGDSLQLMAELLKIFVVEAAVRAVRQAQAEDAILVDVDQLEKVLPQLVRECGSVHRWECLAGRPHLSASSPQLLDF